MDDLFDLFDDDHSGELKLKDTPLMRTASEMPAAFVVAESLAKTRKTELRENKPGYSDNNWMNALRPVITRIRSAWRRVLKLSGMERKRTG